MRGIPKFALVGGALAVITAASIPQSSAAQPAPAAPPAANSIAAGLDAQRTQLLAQLQNGSAKGAALAQAERLLGSLQAQEVQFNNNLNAANKRLANITRQISDDQNSITSGQAQLASILRRTYIDSTQNEIVTAIISADSFQQAMDRIHGAQHVDSRIVDLLQNLANTQTSLKAEQASLTTEISKSQSLEAKLGASNNQFSALIIQRNQQLAAASAAERQSISTMDTVDNQIATANTNVVAPISVSGPCGNHFAFGQCTWYVASRRCIPWFGNAGPWWGAAAAAGYLEGHTPQPGAVAVWEGGQGGASGVGHVAYVESVGATSFTISEMNYGANGGGFDRVDHRSLPLSGWGGIGFIYGHK